MKEEIDKEKPDLAQTIESIGVMYSSLMSLRERIYPQNPVWFAIMAQGPVDDIRNLLDDLESLMKEMIPDELREQAARLRESEEMQTVTAQDAA